MLMTYLGDEVSTFLKHMVDRNAIQVHPTLIKLLRQVVRHRVLIPGLAGSNPVGAVRSLLIRFIKVIVC